MKKFLIFLLPLFFVSLCYADFNFEITQEMKKKQAEITITGKTFDEVWSATTRSLMALKFRIKESEKDSGTIFAQKKKSIFDEGDGERSSWEIMIEADEGKIVVFCIYTLGEMALSAKKPFKKFCKKLKERLSD